MTEKHELEPTEGDEEDSSLKDLKEIFESIRKKESSFSKTFYKLGKVFRKGDEAQIKKDLTFLLKWGLKYGGKLSSSKASQAENAHMKTLIGPYKLHEKSYDMELLTVPNLMIEFAGSTLKLAKDMPDTVSGVGKDKRLETPAYGQLIRSFRWASLGSYTELTKCHEEAHLYARYKFTEALNRGNLSWHSKDISIKVNDVKRFYEMAASKRHCSYSSWSGFIVSDKEMKLLRKAACGKNLIPSSIINEASAEWQKLAARAKASSSFQKAETLKLLNSHRLNGRKPKITRKSKAPVLK